ncbi:unnamed protein product [Thlaspi arvense]|uniref:Uncharacterized protein n=1 Tax=Thlaspi arvense TaxID=13288 RepID=A0AAU9RFF6_THLAR|nr:unnamed protein product [Thlaspi arvense]
MKPETKRTAIARRRNNNDDYSPFNLGTLKHAIDAIDAAEEKEKKTLNLASLSSALSVASRKMKQTEKSERKRARDTRKRNQKRPMIATKPETKAELRRWFSNFDESFKQSLTNKKMDQAAPKTLVCEFDTDYIARFSKLPFY